MSITTKSGREVQVPTPTEDQAIDNGIACDSDTHELNEKFFQNARPSTDVIGKESVAELVAMRRSRGRPSGSVAEQTKVTVTMRVDPDVLAALRGTGAGWQTRVNEVLRREFLSSR